MTGPTYSEMVEILWKHLKEQHRWRLEDEYDVLELDDSWSLLAGRIKREIEETDMTYGEIEELLWERLEEQHRWRLEDEYDELEIDDSWSRLRHRVQKEMEGE